MVLLRGELLVLLCYRFNDHHNVENIIAPVITVSTEDSMNCIESVQTYILKKILVGINSQVLLATSV